MWEIALWIAAGLIGLLILLGVIITVVGLLHNKQYQVSRSLSLKQSAEAIWSVITNHADEPNWQSHLERSKQLPDENGNPVWEIKHKGQGNPPMKLTTLESVPPTKLVRRIDDAKKVYTGWWEYQLSPESGATKLTISEKSEIPNPFFRGMFHLFGGPAMFVNYYLLDLARKFGEPAVINDPQAIGL